MYQRGFRSLSPSRAAKFEIRSNDDVKKTTAPIFSRPEAPTFMSVIEQINAPNNTPWASFSKSREISLNQYGYFDSSGSHWATADTPTLLFEINLDLARAGRFVVNPVICAEVIHMTWDLRGNPIEHRDAVTSQLKTRREELLGGEVQLLEPEFPFSFANDAIPKVEVETAMNVSRGDQEFLVAGGVSPEEIVLVTKIIKMPMQ